METINNNIITGFCKTNLFGNPKIIEVNGVGNRTLEIHYMMRKSLNNSKDYMMFFNGGPGVGFSTTFKDMISDPNFFPNVNIICMDQRGTGLSSKALEDLKELKYFTARYIAYDAEEIRKQVLGETTKWMIFGESYGGHIVRKYLELYPDFIEKAISFGYAKNDPVDMKVYIQKQTSLKLNEYFDKYEEDKQIIEQIKMNLTDIDTFSSETTKVSGAYLADFLIFWFGLKEEEDIHKSLQNLKGEDMIERFKNEISPLATLLLNTSSGKLNPAIAYIDILDGLSDEELGRQVDQKLMDLGFNPEKEILSSKRLVRHFEQLKENLSDVYFMELKDTGYYQPDLIDNENIIKNLNLYEIDFHVFGSDDDVYTPIQIIMDEEQLIKAIPNNSRFIYQYVKGSHHAWLHNNTELFKDII